MCKKVLSALLLLIASAGYFSSTNAQSIARAPVKFDGRVYAFRGDMGTTGARWPTMRLRAIGLLQTARGFFWSVTRAVATQSWPWLGGCTPQMSRSHLP